MQADEAVTPTVSNARAAAKPSCALPSATCSITSSRTWRRRDRRVVDLDLDLAPRHVRDGLREPCLLGVALSGDDRQRESVLACRLCGRSPGAAVDPAHAAASKDARDRSGSVCESWFIVVPPVMDWTG